MKKRIKRVAPIRLGKMLAVIYGVFSIIFVPFLLIPTLTSPKTQGPGLVLIIALPILYVVLGFLGGAFSAIVYNVCARWIGGIEIEFDE